MTQQPRGDDDRRPTDGGEPEATRRQQRGTDTDNRRRRCKSGTALPCCRRPAALVGADAMQLARMRTPRAAVTRAGAGSSQAPAQRERRIDLAVWPYPGTANCARVDSWVVSLAVKRVHAALRSRTLADGDGGVEARCPMAADVEHATVLV